MSNTHYRLILLFYFVRYIKKTHVLLHREQRISEHRQHHLSLIFGNEKERETYLIEKFICANRCSLVFLKSHLFSYWRRHMNNRS